METSRPSQGERDGHSRDPVQDIARSGGHAAVAEGPWGSYAAKLESTHRRSTHEAVRSEVRDGHSSDPVQDVARSGVPVTVAEG